MTDHSGGTAPESHRLPLGLRNVAKAAPHTGLNPSCAALVPQSMRFGKG